MVETSAVGVVRRYFEAVARHDLDAAMECWAPGAIDNLDPVGELRVPEELRAYFEELFASMPDFQYEVLDLFEAGNKIATHWRATGSFSGGPYQGMRPNGAKIAVIARQLGVLPPKKSRRERMFIRLFNLQTRLGSLLRRGR